MDETLLETVEVEPSSPARSTVLWLHGLGADGHDFESIVPVLPLPHDHGIRFVFPHAPAIPVSVNQGMVMPAWYDIADIGLRSRHDIEGIRRSCRRIEDLMEREERRGIPSSRIVLAGFSQGGAIALHLGLRFPRPLAGIMALSTYLVEEEFVEEQRTGGGSSVPVFLAHGRFDPVVPFDRGEDARKRLEEWGYPVEWHSYPMQHEVAPQEILDIGRWLSKVLS